MDEEEEESACEPELRTPMGQGRRRARGACHGMGWLPAGAGSEDEEDEGGACDLERWASRADARRRRRSVAACRGRLPPLELGHSGLWAKRRTAEDERPGDAEEGREAAGQGGLPGARGP